MIGTTSTSPLYLPYHGQAVGTIGLTVSPHLGGMCVASPLSGSLCDRFVGFRIVGTCGLALLSAAHMFVTIKLDLTEC